MIEHSIDVGNSKPIKQHPRRVPVALAAEEEKVIQQLQKQGVIRKSTSPWASLICLVQKKSGKKRPCVDYRKLNEITKKDAFPLPRISNCLDADADAKYYSTFDLTSGFHQISIQEQDIEKTAFCTKYGLFEYLTMPMGLTNSPAVFQRLMEIVLRGLQWHTCLIYLDDVLVFGSNFDEHMDRVREVLSRIRDAGLKLKPEKCQLLQTTVSFWGFKLSAAGILPNSDNLSKNIVKMSQARGRAYKCLNCGHVNEKRRVISHIYKEHVGLDEAPFYCKVCLFRSSDEESLRRHVRPDVYPAHHQRMTDIRIQGTILEPHQILMRSLKPNHLEEGLDYLRLTAKESDCEW